MKDKIGKHIYSTKRWAIIRLRVLKRDLYQCQECKGPGNEVDHLRPIPRDWEAARYDAFQTGNLQVLCSPCHARKTRDENRKHPIDPERLKWIDYINQQQQPMRNKTC